VSGRLARALGVLSLAIAAGCASGMRVRADSSATAAKIDLARRGDAQRCAPRELATAEANLDFANADLDAGESGRALDHLREADAAITRAIVAMAQSLRLTVVAEGVETQAQINFLGSLGCTIMQGFLLSRPLTAPAIAITATAATAKLRTA